MRIKDIFSTKFIQREARNPYEQLDYTIQTRPPRTTDNSYSLPFLWLDTIGNSAYLLVDVTADVAKWSTAIGASVNLDTQNSVKAIAVCTSTPPTEVLGDRYILDETAGTVHANWDGASKKDIVEFDGATWVATTPTEGVLCEVEDINTIYLYITSWIAWQNQALITTSSPTFTAVTVSKIDSGYATVTSHATTSAIWAAAGNTINFTGTETITALPAAPQAGAQRILICAGACVFTHAGALTVQGGVTRTCVAGDIVVVTATTTTAFKINFIAHTETGTGSTVRATSPTLVTPLLGTPTSGNLSNCDFSTPPAIGATTPAAVYASPVISKGPAAVTTFAGTVSTSGSSTTITWSSAADAILAGYNATNPVLGTTIITGPIKQASVTRYVVSWTNSTACVVDTACTLAAATELTSVQLPIAVSVTSTSPGVLESFQTAAGIWIQAGVELVVTSKNKSLILLSDLLGPLIKRQTYYWNGSAYVADTSYGFGYNALQSNTGSSSNGFGYYALQSNTGSSSNGFGYNALLSNTGAQSNGFGNYALHNNTGTYSNGFGYLALQNNTGSSSNGFGYGALYNNTGSSSNGFGYGALYNNTGTYSNGFGYYALYNNNWPYAIGIGHQATSYFLADAATSKSFTDAEITATTVAITTHGFGTGKKNLLFTTTTGTPPSGLVTGTVYYVTLTNANLITLGTALVSKTIDTATAVSNVAGKLTITSTAHGYLNSDSVYYANGGGTSIGGLTTATRYFVSNKSADTFELAATAGGVSIDWASNGVGAAHTFTQTGSSDFAGTFQNSVDITDSIAIGKDVNASKANQVVLGSTTTTETLLNGNVGINTTTFGTGAAKVQAMGSGTAPTTSPADASQIYVIDKGAVAGKAAVHMRDEAGNSGPVAFQNIIELVKASDVALTLAEVTGHVVNNYGQAADTTITLPAIAAGMNFTVILGTTVAKYFRVDPNASDVVYLDGVAAAAGKYVGVASATAGNAIQFVAFQTGAATYSWMATTISGSWVSE